MCISQYVLTDRMSSLALISNQLPNGLHYEWTMRAIRAGKHVLVEKPLADTAEEARKMIDYAKEKDVILLEAIHYT